MGFIIWKLADKELPNVDGDYLVKVMTADGKPIQSVRRFKQGQWFGGCRPFAGSEVLTHWGEFSEDDVHWIDVNKQLPDRFEGVKRFRVKIEAGSIQKQSFETVIMGRWYPSGFRFSVSDWQKVTHWCSLE